MSNNSVSQFNFAKKFACVVAELFIFAAAMMFSLAWATPSRGQTAAASPAADWETAAGGMQEFDVASVKQNVSGAPAHHNLNSNDADPSTHTGGLLSATDFPLGFYIGFA